MKISSREVEKEFKPIKLSIVFETAQELEMFYGAVGCSFSDIKDSAEGNSWVNTDKWDSHTDSTYELYDWAEEQLNEIHDVN